MTVIVEREEGFDGFAAVKIAQLPPGVEAVPTTEYGTDKTLSDEDRERYAPESQTVTVMLIAKADAPLKVYSDAVFPLPRARQPFQAVASNAAQFQ